jgi:hypothetical protein
MLGEALAVNSGISCGGLAISTSDPSLGHVGIWADAQSIQPVDTNNDPLFLTQLNTPQYT